MFTLHSYKNRSEMERTHPEIKSFTCVLQIPRGTTTEGVINTLRKRGAQGALYQVGNFVWKPAETTPPICRCLERIGDNGPCPKHGPGLPQGRV